MNDESVREAFGRANHLAEEAQITCRFVYRHQEPKAAQNILGHRHLETTVDVYAQTDQRTMVEALTNLMKEN